MTVSFDPLIYFFLSFKWIALKGSGQFEFEKGEDEKENNHHLKQKALTYQALEDICIGKFSYAYGSLFDHQFNKKDSLGSTLQFLFSKSRDFHRFSVGSVMKTLPDEIRKDHINFKIIKESFHVFVSEYKKVASKVFDRRK